MTIIYAITDNNTPRYIGKTIASLKRRLSTHMYNARSGRCKSPLGNWLRELIKTKRKPFIIPLEQIEDNGDWQKAERKWIASCRQNGIPLLNVLDGGNGQHHMIQLKPKFIKLMGIKSDNHIAKLAGCSRKTITYHREKLDIKASNNYSDMRPWNRGLTGLNYIPINKQIIPMLGEYPDPILAKKANVSVGTIKRWRKQLNIKAYYKGK